MDTFREKLEQKYRKYRATLILTNAVVGADRTAIDDQLEDIRRLPTVKLRQLAKDFDVVFKGTMKRYGVVADLQNLERVITPDAGNTGDAYLFLAKSALMTLFTRYERAYPPFARLPPHARIAIDVFGLRRPGDLVETFILEAALHEDLATLWNAAVDAHAISSETPRPRLIKHAGALLRAAAKAAFNLLEAYINGLALDIILLEKDITPAQRANLTEFDEVKEKPKMLSLRDKLLQYPKIAVGAQHPPVQESSSVAMAKVLALEKRVRHALIHPTPLVDTRKPDDFREIVFMALSLGEVADLCDSVITLIGEIAQAVGPEYGEVKWLERRGEDGRFREELFA